MLQFGHNHQPAPLPCSNLFSLFDKLTDRHGVYKVETIGDCYMACAGGTALPPAGCNMCGHPGQPGTLMLLLPLGGSEASFQMAAEGLSKLPEAVGGLHLPAAGLTRDFMGTPSWAAAGHDEDDDKKAKGSPTQRMLAIAVDMLQAVQDLTVPNGGSVRVRVGMHVGPAYAGWVSAVPGEGAAMGHTAAGLGMKFPWDVLLQLPATHGAPHKLVELA